MDLYDLKVVIVPSASDLGCWHWTIEEYKETIKDWSVVGAGMEISYQAAVDAALRWMQSFVEFVPTETPIQVNMPSRIEGYDLSQLQQLLNSSVSAMSTISQQCELISALIADKLSSSDNEYEGEDNNEFIS